jgi:Flp pilus assembly pilin Flp
MMMHEYGPIAAAIAAACALTLTNIGGAINGKLQAVSAQRYR